MIALKYEIIIDPAAEERVVVYAKQETSLTQEIARLCEERAESVLGYRDSEIVKLSVADIHYISVTGGKVYAFCDSDSFVLKERLYTLESRLPNYFIKINQSCLANIKKTERFDTSLSGTLKIYFKNGHTDYVSRRQLRAVKERLGL